MALAAEAGRSRSAGRSPSRLAGAASRLTGRVARRAPASAPAAPDTVLRLAVLLQAGVAPAIAWSHLAADGDRAARLVVDAVHGGATVPAALVSIGPSWRPVAAAWSVAETVGAPLAATLRGLARTRRESGEAEADVRVALAEPAGTARLMAWLPLAGVLLGLALGFDTVGAVVTNPLGGACVVAGLLLVLAARRWSGMLVRRASPGTDAPGLRAELMAIALSGGVSIERATVVVDEAGAPSDDGGVAGILSLSQRAGAPAVELLRAAAALERHRHRTEGRLRAARLSTTLLIPLGVCTLPAFLLLGVAPMLLSAVSTTPLSW